jgi:hypothetical protein
MRLQRVGMLKAAKRDLQGRFHLVFLSFRLFKNRSVTMAAQVMPGFPSR